MKRAVRAAAGRTLDLLLNSPAGNLVERGLCRLARVAPAGVSGSGVVLERLMARHGDLPLIVTLGHGLRLSVPSALDGWGLYLRGRMCAEDEALAHLLRRFLHHGDVFFDVGANLGYYACIAAQCCGPSGQVHAFEPQAHLVRHIRESLRLNGFDGVTGMQVNRAAVSSKDGGTITLFLAQDKDRYANAAALLRHEWLAGGSTEEVPALSLDGYIRERGLSRVDLVKIDVEGAEPMVLEGLRDTLTRTPPDAIVSEVLPATLRFDDIQPGKALRPDPATRRPSAVVTLLAKYGFAPHHITPEGSMGASFTLDEMGRLTTPANVLFVRPGIESRRPGIV